MQENLRMLAAIMSTDITGYTAIMQEKQGFILFIRPPHWKELHSDPRFIDIIKRMGFDEV